MNSTINYYKTIFTNIKTVQAFHDPTVVAYLQLSIN